MHDIWSEVINCLQSNLSTTGFQTFLSSSKLVHIDEHSLTIEVPNSFSREWMRDTCEPIIREKIPDIGYNTIFHYTILENQATQEEQQLTIFSDTLNKKKDIDQFNPKYTFDNFVVGHNNRFAYASCEAVSNLPAKAYNPLFIYGSVGLGKTHLIHAIGRSICHSFPNMKTKLVSCEKFTNDLINSIRDKKVELFRQKYRTVDLLIVDDIQFLAGKEQTQEEFFHTFNDIYNVNKQIVITSDRTPKEIPTLEERLRTRFEWGLIADMQPPDLETRIAILKKKIELNNFNISDDILHCIASQIPTNVREMEGALTRIIAYASLLNTNVTLSIAHNVIRDIIGIKKELFISIEQIQQKTCDYFGVSIHEILSKSRKKEISYARQIAMYLSRELTKISLPKIGEAFGNRDHSTVMHACEKIKTAIEYDSETKNIVNILLSNIKESV